jgi:hypothetical protein
MSSSSCPLAIVAALQKFDDLLGPDRKWDGISDGQRAFLETFYLSYLPHVKGFPEIESIASKSAEAINKFLAERGFSIRLEEFGPDELGTASVLDLLVKWMQTGKLVDISTSDKIVYPGVHLEHSVDFFISPKHKHPIAKISSQTQTDHVYMIMLDQPVEGFDLVRLAHGLSTQRLVPTSEYEGLHFPMVDYDQEIDISFLCGLQTHDQTGQLWFINQALQQNKLRLDEHGARAQSAVALGAMRGVTIKKSPHIINQPFLVWFMREGIELPLFVGYMTPENWKRPKSTLEQ